MCIDFSSDFPALISPSCIGLLYLVCVTILPDVLETDMSVNMRLYKVGSFILGLGFIYSVASLEDMDEHGHEHGNEHGHEHGNE